MERERSAMGVVAISDRDGAASETLGVPVVLLVGDSPPAPTNKDSPYLSGTDFLNTPQGILTLQGLPLK